MYDANHPGVAAHEQTIIRNHIRYYGLERFPEDYLQATTV